MRAELKDQWVEVAYRSGWWLGLLVVAVGGGGGVLTAVAAVGESLGGDGSSLCRNLPYVPPHEGWITD